MIVQASNKKQYAIEQKPLLRILASGLKFTDESMRILGLKAKDTVNYAYDDESGAVYLYKADEGSTIGDNKTFTNTGFKSALLKLATGNAIIKDGATSDEKVSQDTEIKGGLQIRFEVAESPTTQDGVAYHAITFKEAVVDSSDKEEGEAAPKKAKETAKSDF